MYIINPEGPAGRCEDQRGPLLVSCWSSVPPPPHVFTCLICGESYIPILSPEKQFLSSQYRSHLVLWHWLSLYQRHQPRHIISILHLTQRKSKLTLFRLSLCLFSDRSPGFLELFSNSSCILYIVHYGIFQILNNTIKLLFDIVCYSDPGNVIQVFFPVRK